MPGHDNRRLYGANCKKQDYVKHFYNENAKGFIKNTHLSYFGKECPDPYTALAYWRRRFGGQECYLNNYFIPYTTRFNKWSVGKNGGKFRQGYKGNGSFNVGYSIPILYLTKAQYNANKAYYKQVFGGNPKTTGCTAPSTYTGF